MRPVPALATLPLLALLAACETPQAPTPPAPPTPPAADPAAVALQARAASLFQALPAQPVAGSNELSAARVELGKTLFFETRMSKNQELSCNSCHSLDKYGVDGKPTSTGFKGQLGGRNSPTVYNASLHLAQFWDGRAPDVEAQAKGPILNPIEMAMPDDAHVVTVLKSIPGYAPLFAAAFPGQADPISYDNMATAIGAFERSLLTPAPFDRYLGGDLSALSPEQQVGLATFMDTGCTTCHAGVTVGGQMYQKIGLVKPYDTTDMGRFDITHEESDKMVFKVPSLRNIDHTAPYFHDGKVATLDQAILLMADHQLGKQLEPAQVAQITTFLGSLTGPLPTQAIAPPTLPESGPDTPKADPT